MAIERTDGDGHDIFVQVHDLAKEFDVSPPFLNRVFEGAGRVMLRAVDRVSFAIPRGRTFSLVGESGCGKPTVARLVVGLYAPTRGRIEFEGTDLATLKTRAEIEPVRKRLQIDAIPDLGMTGRARTPVGGEVPSPIHPPPGCHFHPRCPHANDRCRAEAPAPIRVGATEVACHGVEERRIPIPEPARG